MALNTAWMTRVLAPRNDSHATISSRKISEHKKGRESKFLVRKEFGGDGQTPPSHSNSFLLTRACRVSQIISDVSPIQTASQWGFK